MLIVFVVCVYFIVCFQLVIFLFCDEYNPNALVSDLANAFVKIAVVSIIIINQIIQANKKLVSRKLNRNIIVSFNYSYLKGKT
jgi:hypothetical protein